MDNETLVLTPSALLAFLSQIEELKDLDIELAQVEGSLDISIGNTTYTLLSPDDSVVEVNDMTIDEISEIDEQGYDEIELDETESELVGGEAVEGGIIKELIKTLAIGGLVRLTKDALNSPRKETLN